jgi:hypothetical protein
MSPENTGKFWENLRERRQAIVARWRDAIIRTYPPDAARFLLKNRDQFANPIGRTVAEEAEALIDALIIHEDLSACDGSIDRIVRIRAVQQFTPGEAVSFIFLLKPIVNAVIEQFREESISIQELLELHRRIDNLALMAFDAYMNCREQIFRIRTGELKKWSSMTGEQPPDSEENDNC